MDMFDNTKVFSVLDSQGMNTLAFQVNTTIEENEKVYSIERMKAFIEQTNKGFKKTFFFNPEPKENEAKTVIFLTIKPGEAILNGGEFMNGYLAVGKKPGAIKYSSIKISGDESEYREYFYTPNFKRKISIIDPILGDEVKPVVFLDTETNMLKAKIKLLPDKSYIALEVK